MEETRTSLTEKLETLEQKLEANVKDTVTAVTDTVQSVTGAVQDTVEAVKDTVAGTVEAVKDSVEGTVETVADAFDIRHHFEQHPWLTLAGAAVAGYMIGRLMPRSPDSMTGLMSQSPGAGQPAAYGGPQQAPASPSSPAPSAPPAAQEPGWTDQLADALAPALSKLKELAIGTSLGLVGEMVLPQLPETFRKEVGDALEQITTALGGKPIRAFREHAEARAQASDATAQQCPTDGGAAQGGHSPANRISQIGPLP